MLHIKVNKRNAESLRRYAARQNLLSRQYKVLKDNNFIYFPIEAGGAAALARLERKFGATSVNRRPVRTEGKLSYNEIALKELGSEKFEKISKSYDILGNIAVIDSNSMSDAKKLAKVILAINKNVSTVIMKGSAVRGIYRTRAYRHVAGRRTYIALYKENGAVFRFDVRRVFFSPRLSYERKRVASAAKDYEHVAVMFAGVGPFAIEIAKAHPHSEVVAIELNEHAYRYMKENIKINNVRNVAPELGDVKRVAAKYKEFADRIVMPLPKSTYSFLGSALAVAKSKCVVHYYAFGRKSSAVNDNLRLIKDFFSRHGAKVKFICSRVVRPYSATEDEVVIDFEILK